MAHEEDDGKNSLWTAYVKTVKPLAGKKTSPPKIEEKKISFHQQKSFSSLPKHQLSSNRVEFKPHSTPQFQAEKNAKKRMRKGKFSYTAKIDLHGFTQNQAYDRLVEFITHNYHNNCRHLLIITGRGRFCYKNLSPTGILITKVPEWLRHQPFARMISVIEQASVYDGGEGALYVILKKV